MPRGLSDAQIERTTRELLVQRHRVTVRDVMQALRARFGGCGRTERICRILKRLESQDRPSVVSASIQSQELEALHERVRAAEARAALSEERERQHQDLWASRYAEKVAALEKKQLNATRRAPGITHDQYLRVHQRAAELARRLAKYEDPDKPAIEEGAEPL
jgi:hypothetical protein